MQKNTLLPILLGAGLVILLLLSWHLSDRRRRGEQGPRTQKPRQAHMPSAMDLLATTKELQRAGADWVQIAGRLNPAGHQGLAAAIERLRGPHLFAPHIALNVVAHGCEAAIAKHPQASALDALAAAERSLAKVTRAGD
jgi:hypothetical protein